MPFVYIFDKNGVPERLINVNWIYKIDIIADEDGNSYVIYYNGGDNNNPENVVIDEKQFANLERVLYEISK